MKYNFRYAEDRIVLHVEQAGDGLCVRLPDSSAHMIAGTRLADNIVRICLSLPSTSTYEGKPLPSPSLYEGETWGSERKVMECATRIFQVPCARTERGIELSWEGRTYVFQPVTVDSAGAARRTHSGSLTAPMVGVVAEVLVEEGQRVEAHQPLAVVEAMKVMATVEAPFAGRVTKVHVHKGERVVHGAPVVDVAPD